jgi:PAS domain S-box-containing protein
MTRRIDPRKARLALRWMLILATAMILLPFGPGGRPRPFDTILILAFVFSNIALSLLKPATLHSRALEYVVVISDTFLVSLALFHAGLQQSHLPLVFFLTLILAALGPDLPRMVVGTSLVAGLYLYLTWRAGAPAGAAEVGGLFMRLPFLYVAGLYYGHLVQGVRQEQAEFRRVVSERRDLETFLEVTNAANSSLDLHEVLYTITRRIALLVNAQRCSILTVKSGSSPCKVLASSDNPAIDGLTLDLDKYPEVRRAIESRQVVVINDIVREPLLEPMRDKLMALGYHSIIVLPMMSGDSLLGMLFIRAARQEGRFSAEEIDICQVVANASANALRNAMLFEQVRSEARSRQETLEKLQNILDHFPDLIYTTDLDARLTEFSRGGEGLLGYTRAEAIQLGQEALYPEPDARARLQRVVREGVPVSNLETTVLSRAGVHHDVIVGAAPLRDEQGRLRGSVGIITNVTELKAAQRHLLQAEKLSAIGEVVSGVAHELNNPLAGVLGYAQLLMAGPIEPRQQRSIERIFESAVRCQKIVQNLLAFARQHPAEKRFVDLNDIIEKTLDLKAYQLRVNNLKVVKTLAPGLPKTMLDFTQIQQVLLNVINNAQYSISRHKGQGTLKVSTSVKDGVMRLEVADDGGGIPREILGRIFDPFFTTKPVGEGTGLGLSVSYGIVKEHGGRIWAESAPSRGTTLIIELPIRSDVAGDGSPRATASTPDRPLRILAVDDESVILDLIVDALARDGHHIDTAGGGREAIEKIERESYDVLVCDLKMPGMDGQQLFETLRTRWPRLAERVIFASGDTIHPETRRFILESGRPCVDKPFKLESLVAAIAQVAADNDERRRLPAVAR